MSSIEVHLKSLAVRIAHRLQRRAELANGSLPRARQILAEIRVKYEALASAALRVSPDSPFHEIARQADKDLAAALAEVSSLELKQQRAIAAQQRAQTYVPLNGRGSYSCPQCWVGENLVVGMSLFIGARLDEVFECPTCGCRFTRDHDFPPRSTIIDIDVTARSATP